MTTRTFTLTLDDGDRLMILTALGFSAMHLITASAPIDMRRPIDALIQRLSTANGQDAPPPNVNERANPLASQPVNSGTQAARDILAPAHAPRDRWARDRKGNELPNPEGCETVTRLLSKVDRKDTREGKPRMVAIWDSPTGQGFVEAACFDESLFPFLALRAKQETVVHVKKNGKYLNIVGVRA